MLSARRKIGAVCPIEDGAALIGAHWATVMKAGDAVLFADSQKKLDKGAIDLRFLEWLYGPGNDEDILMWARAYNGQFDDLGEPVSLRLATSDYARLRGEMNGFNEAVEREERIDETGVLGSPLIFRAYEALCKEYKVKMTELFGTLTRLVLPPLASAYLGRLPKGATAEQMLDILFTLREELAPVRAKFALLRASDHPDVSPAEAQKSIAAISADAKSFAKRWDSSVTDNAVIQFCLEHVSFVLKCLLKPDKVEAEEIAAKLAKIAPPLERYLRSSAPTELSTIALETRKIGQIKHLLDAKLGLRFAD
jgi:hypothetical protein